jgi:hypothetical protein
MGLDRLRVPRFAPFFRSFLWQSSISPSRLVQVGGTNLGIHAFFGCISVFYTSEARPGLIAFLASFLTLRTRILDLHPFQTDKLRGRRKGVHMHRHDGCLKRIVCRGVE